MGALKRNVAQRCTLGQDLPGLPVEPVILKIFYNYL